MSRYWTWFNVVLLHSLSFNMGLLSAIVTPHRVTYPSDLTLSAISIENTWVFVSQYHLIHFVQGISAP